MRQLTKDQAIEFAENKSWESMNYRQRAEFQILQDKLCMPFSVFHEAVEKTLDRPVFTHEFGLNLDGIIDEMFNEKAPPSLEDIIDMLPSDKALIVG